MGNIGTPLADLRQERAPMWVFGELSSILPLYIQKEGNPIFFLLVDFLGTILRFGRGGILGRLNLRIGKRV